MQQVPSSEMAQEWCVSYGILPETEAYNIHVKVCKRKGKPVSSPMRNDVKKPTTSRNVKPRRIQDDDIEADTGMERGSAWEGRGAIGV